MKSEIAYNNERSIGTLILKFKLGSPKDGDPFYCLTSLIHNQLLFVASSVSETDQVTNHEQLVYIQRLKHFTNQSR